MLEKLLTFLMIKIVIILNILLLAFVLTHLLNVYFVTIYNIF